MVKKTEIFLPMLKLFRYLLQTQLKCLSSFDLMRSNWNNFLNQLSSTELKHDPSKIRSGNY